MTLLSSFDEVQIWLDAHQRLHAQPAAGVLGRFHALIETADRSLGSKLQVEVPAGIGDFKRLELTSLGREVGADVPRWWVMTQAPDVGKLWTDTKHLFVVAQSLVRSCERFSRDGVSTYEALIDEIVDFSRSHADEFQHLLGYAEQLFRENEHAPAILFSYAVWGSTRRSDRALGDHVTIAAVTDADVVRSAAELALGVWRRTGPVLFWEWLDIVGDAMDAADDEHPPTGIPADRLLHRTQSCVRENLVTYFTEIRDSVRHIDNLCQEYFERENLYADDRFLQALVAKVSDTTITETDLWDLKQTLDVWEVEGPRKRDAAATFVEDVAAFANHRGGVLIIGVSNERKVVGVPDTENRLKHIEEMVAALADTSEPFVRARSIAVEVDGTVATCIAIVVGSTEAPIGVLHPDRRYTYPVRVGAGIERRSREDVAATKQHAKGVRFGFAAELARWVGR